ncbi:hypothetical protein [Corallococcus carmarthensis]|uniref:hypothetical protein n=1 Tax=Corallococcus carmarthensis TaxID=2316728 RepID=UPI00148DCD55|nr:hypothetical protein [Corallococcus carmarthensis]NOK21988.1 hypothetical protein [Corallococcus carmarthensis]
MSHVRWEDLLEEEEAAAPAPASGAGASAAAPVPSLEEVAASDPELAALLKERQQLEGTMKALSGVQEAPVDERLAKQFPVVQHTPESRIAERKQHERDTARRLLEQKLYARRRTEAEEAERVEQLRRERLETGKAARRKDQKQQTLRQQWARKARERAKLATRLAERVLESPGKGRMTLGELGSATRDAARRLADAADAARSAARNPMPLVKGQALPSLGALGRALGGRGGLQIGKVEKGVAAARELWGMAPRSMDAEALMMRGLAMAGMDMESMEQRMDMEMERAGMGMDDMDARDTARDAQRARGRQGARDE